MSSFKEGDIEITESSEQAVVSKEARVVEEVVVGKQVSEREQVVSDTVRRTDVEVEEVDGDTETDVNTRKANS
jgi:stress response protein YsnF